MATAGISFCYDLCRADTDVPCVRDYLDEPPYGQECPVFSNAMWRVGARVIAGGQAHDRLAGYVGLQLVAGRRVSRALSIVALGHLAFVVDDRPRPAAALGLEVGLESLLFNLLWQNSALAIMPSVGVWSPGGCENDRCPVALPMGSLAISQMMFGRSAFPEAEGFGTLTVGVEGGIGYDPFLDLALGRASLMVGADFAFF